MNTSADSMFNLIDAIIGTNKTKLFSALKEIIKQTNSDTQEWFNHQQNRDKIKDKLGITEPTMNKYINTFSKNDILIKQAPRGLYKLNDKYIKVL